MNLNIKKCMIALIAIFLSSCGNKGDKYIGTWKCGDSYLNIKKAGNEMYSVDHWYCKFEDGCFIEYEKDRVVCCINDGAFNYKGKIGKKIE